MSLANRSSERVENILAQYHTDMDRPADLLADIMHHCEINGIDFEQELATASDYVKDELGWDEQFPS